MDETEIIADLSSKSVKRILSAVVALSDIMKNGSFDSELVDPAFESILPLLSHTHYKIRAYAFSILTKFFENHLNALSNGLLALPHILLSLLSVSPQIKENAYRCLEIILKNYKLSDFWFDIEAIITKGRSLEERVRVLQLLRDISSKIPLCPIVKLVDDPLYQIRNEAFAILASAPRDPVLKAVKATKISYDGLKLLITKLPFLGKGIPHSPIPRQRMGAMDVSEITDSMNAMNQSLGVSDSDDENPRTKHVQISQEGSTAVKSRGPVPLRRGSPRSLGPIRDLSKQAMRRNRAAGMTDLSSSRLAEANLSGLQNIDTVDLRRLRSLACPQRAKPGEVAKKAFRPGRTTLGPKKVILKAKTLLAPEEEEKHEDPPLNTLGNLEMSIGGPVFRVRDMSRATWLEKLSFLDYMRESLESGMQMGSTPEEMIDCLMAIGKPAHKKITFAIPPILSDVLVRSPEVIGERLREIVTFTLFAMVGDIWREDPDFEAYLSILIREADPTDIISMCLVISDRTERPLPFELLIMFVYEHKSGLRLPYSVASHLICSLLNRQRTESQEELLRFICEREVNHAVQWGSEQPASVRRKLLPYVKGYTPAPKREATTSRKREPEIRTTDPKKLLAIAIDELKKGKKCDLGKLCLALGVYEGEIPYKIYTAFLDVVGRLPESAITQNNVNLRKLCATTFDRPNYMGFLHEEWVPPERITGFSRIVWNSNPNMLQGSDKNLSRLYALFLDSTGPGRLDICKIFLAIEHATSHSILDLPEVKNPYRKLIESMLKQFRVSK